MPLIAAPSTIQTDNTAGGDIVGGNKNVFQFSSESPSSRLADLLEMLKKELECDKKAQEIIDELKRYKEPHAKSTKDLETKLTEANRKHLLQYAREAKETFTKKLVKFDLFESAQDLHAMVLAQIVHTFTSRISPQLISGAPNEVIEELIDRLIIAPLVNQLNKPPLRYNHLTVAGMIYFLTGNCHIDWA